MPVADNYGNTHIFVLVKLSKLGQFDSAFITEVVVGPKGPAVVASWQSCCIGLH